MKLMKGFIPFAVCSLIALASRGQDTPAPEAPKPAQVPDTLPASQPPAATPGQPGVVPVPPQAPRSADDAFRARYGIRPAAGGGIAAAVPPAPMSFSDRLRNIINRAQGGGAETGPLLIRTSSMDPKEQANLEQDLAIMAHILDKAAEETPAPTAPARAMGIDVFHTGAAAQRPLYLEGYGTLFTLSVGFPLVPPPASGTPEKEQAAGPSTWEEARQELYGGTSGTVDPTTGLPAPATPYFSRERVEHLQEALLDALKNASNIRGLKPDDSVTVCVLGGKLAGPNRPIDPATGLPVIRTSVMTLRVKKAEVDALAKGKVSAEEFRKRAHVETYLAAKAGEEQQVFGAVAGAGGF